MHATQFPNFANNTPWQRTDFTLLIQDLRKATGAKGMLFTIAVRASYHAKDHYELDQLAGNSDWLNLMTYDYHGAFDKGQPNGVNAPIKDCSNSSTDGIGWDAAGAVDTYLNAGIPPDHINFGLATYGRAVTINSSSSTPGASSVTGKIRTGELQRNRCTWGYSLVPAWPKAVQLQGLNLSKNFVSRGWP